MSLIHILDEIVLAAPDVARVLALLDGSYLPGLAARPSLVLRARWVSPPVAVDGVDNTLWLLWEVSEPYGYYAMRGAAGPEVAQFWAEVDALARKRRRHVLQDAALALAMPVEAP